MMKGTSVCDACTLAVRLTIVLEFYDDGFSEEVADAVLASSARGSSVVVDEVVNPSHCGNAACRCAGDGLCGEVSSWPGS